MTILKGYKMKPNIIFVFSDQQRWDTCGCYGQQLPVTPNLDKMAEDGVLFENAFTCQPVCGPARSALQSGLWPTEIGCNKNHMHMPAELETTLAKEMKKAGYSTSYIGKWHLASGPNENVPDYNPDYRIYPVPEKLRGGYDYWLASDVLEFTSHGYDGHMFDTDNNIRFFPQDRYRADAHTDWVLDYLDTQKDQAAPYFLFISYIEPHNQNDHNCYEGPKGSKEKFANYQIPGDLAGRQGDWPENYPDYLGCCNSLDYNLGRIRRKVEEMGQTDNTLIIYTSDHGCHFRTRKGVYKRVCHESNLRIPMIAYGPGFTGGRATQRLVSLMDIPKTLLAAAGGDLPEKWHGAPLQQALDESKPWREVHFAQLSESQTGRCIRTHKWKYSVCADGGNDIGKDSAVYYEDFLYDLENDPHERLNLVSCPDHKAVRAKMKELLLKEIMTAEKKTPEIKPKK